MTTRRGYLGAAALAIVLVFAYVAMLPALRSLSPDPAWPTQHAANAKITASETVQIVNPAQAVAVDAIDDAESAPVRVKPNEPASAPSTSSEPQPVAQPVAGSSGGGSTSGGSSGGSGSSDVVIVTTPEEGSAGSGSGDPVCVGTCP